MMSYPQLNKERFIVVYDFSLWSVCHKAKGHCERTVEEMGSYYDSQDSEKKNGGAGEGNTVFRSCPHDSHLTPTLNSRTIVSPERSNHLAKGFPPI